MRLLVRHVGIPPMSTIGNVTCEDLDTGDLYAFVTDHRPARNLGEAIGAGERVELDSDDQIAPWMGLHKVALAGDWKQKKGGK